MMDYKVTTTKFGEEGWVKLFNDLLLDSDISNIFPQEDKELEKSSTQLM